VPLYPFPFKSTSNSGIYRDIKLCCLFLKGGGIHVAPLIIVNLKTGVLVNIH
jgi:hypothetical protein